MKTRTFRRTARRSRRGVLPLEAALNLNVFFVSAALLYFLAIRGLSGLHQIVAIFVGSPYS